MRSHALAVAFLLLLLPPLAAAGSEAQPQVESPRDRRDASGDLLAAWISSQPQGLRISIKVADLDARETLHVYGFSLRVDGVMRTPAIGFDQMGRLRTDSGANPNGWGTPRVAAHVDDALAGATVERGEAEILSATIPWGLYDLRPGSDVVPVGASASLYDRAAGKWIAPYDTAVAAREEPYRVQAAMTNAPRDLLPIYVPAWVIPTIVAGLAVGGALGGGALAYATRAAPPPAAAPPVRPPPAPPGKRFRKAP